MQSSSIGCQHRAFRGRVLFGAVVHTYLAWEDRLVGLAWDFLGGAGKTFQSVICT
jgi:hypothetical protein